jgi:multisubunit Na+/H+ antiporter MnhB subunit
MHDIFLSTEFLSYRDLLLETLGLICVSFFSLWLMNLIGFNRKKKSDFSLNIRLKLNYLMSLGVLAIILSIYLAVLYFLNGNHSFKWLEFEWNTTNIYLRLLPQITIFMGIILLFTRTYSKLTELTKK